MRCPCVLQYIAESLHSEGELSEDILYCMVELAASSSPGFGRLAEEQRIAQLLGLCHQVGNTSRGPAYWARLAQTFCIPFVPRRFSKQQAHNVRHPLLCLTSPARPQRQQCQ
jgi:hypothetical protein